MVQLNIRPLTTELKLKAEQDIGESHERMENDIQELKTWISQLDYIKIRTEDQFLISFLRSSKYNIERTKEKLDLYYRRKVVAPEVFPPGKAKNPKILEILRLGIAIPFPHLESPTASKVVLIRAGMFNPSEIHISEVFQMAMMMNEILLLEDDNFVVSGLINIIDMRGIRAMHLAQFTPKVIEKTLYLTQEALPIRQRGFHFLNLPLGFNTAFTLFKSLFNAKNAARLKDSNFVLEVHGNDVESLYKLVPKELFPTEYGGEQYSIPDVISEWERKFKKYEGYFTDDEEYKIDASKPDLGNKKPVSLPQAFRSISVD